jgi:soluble lytic murein transglycosylase
MPRSMPSAPRSASRLFAALLGAAGVLSAAPAAAYDPAASWCEAPESVDPAWFGRAPTMPGFLLAERPPPAPLLLPSERPPTAEELREALGRARAAARRGEATQAALELTLLRDAHPEIADRVDLWEGELRRLAGPADERACRAFERAEESRHESVALSARIGAVDCRLAMFDRDAVAALDRLSSTYPELPQRQALRLRLGEAHERWGEPRQAARIYRALDLYAPGSSEAVEARRRLARLAAAGTGVAPLSDLQAVERLERLSFSGPHELTRAALAGFGERPLSDELGRRVDRVGARLARIEGRWADARRLLRRSRGMEADDEPALDRRARQLARAAENRTVAAVERRLERLLGGRALRRHPKARVMNALAIAARGRAADRANDLAGDLLRRELSPTEAFEAGVSAAGTVDDGLVAALFERALGHQRLGTAARYHRASALARLGRHGEARSELRRVIEDDSTRLPFYAMWARQRLAALPRAAGDDAKAGDAAAVPTRRVARPRPVPSTAEVERRLRALARSHGDAFPFFGRALVLLQLGERDAARDEIYEAYLAFREASGNGALRAGLPAVLLGDTPPRRRVSEATRRARRNLPAGAQEDLARVAAGLGEAGLAIKLRGFSVTGTRPGAFREEVERAAALHGVDPDLLHAVMRVESVYDPRIISYAGAIGLMQIMPRTGRSIAHALGRDGFTVDELLDPATNVEFAAWYLASLLRRWDGRLPLAIASYNGGPHNVRRWLRDHSPDMPLDAFLERIGFDQTHRYVRRVLTHYEAYRALRGLPMVDLDLSLPAEAADAVAF